MFTIVCEHLDQGLVTLTSRRMWRPDVPTLFRKPQSFLAAAGTSSWNLTAKNGSDWGHTDTTRILCFEVSHFCQRHENNNVRYIHTDHLFKVWHFSGLHYTTLLRASTWLISSRFCWEILWPSSSDTQPSQDRHALSNTCWTEVDSVTWEKHASDY